MQSHSKVLLFLFVVGLWVSVAVSARKPINSGVPTTTNGSTANKVIAGYKQWTQVNTEPEQVDATVSLQCGMATSVMRSKSDQNPHRDKFVLVYVNDIGKPAMTEQKRPLFPEGSVIIKEKLSTKDSTSPEVLTVMRKREPGYDPDKGNWEYMVFDGTGQTLQASGKLENCQGCHVQYRAMDYVSRVYLPAKLWEQLR